MHETVVKILEENHIITSERDKSKHKIEDNMREVLKLQETFLSLNQAN
jgi:hypothetical protein